MRWQLPSGGEVLLLLAGQLFVDAGVGEAGPDGQVQVELVAEPGRDDGVGRDLRVVAAGQVVVAAGQRGAGGPGLAVGGGGGGRAGGGGEPGGPGGGAGRAGTGRWRRGALAGRRASPRKRRPVRRGLARW